MRRCPDVTRITNFEISNVRTRFRHCLNAPAAIRGELGKSPVTYLNRGAPYSLSVEDTSTIDFNIGERVYSTTIQISFDTKQHRQNPAHYWQLWGQGRACNTALVSERDFRVITYKGSLESCNQSQPAELHGVHSDSFSVIWRVDGSSLARLSVSFELNFLSTDFSFAKGVNGDAMRLCGQTQQIWIEPMKPSSSEQLMSYCRVKLFRSRGAERKMENDVEIAKKHLRKLNKHLSALRTPHDNRNLIKGKRWTLPKGVGQTRRGAAGNVAEDGLRRQIKNIEKVLGCTRSHSFLDQQGEKQESHVAFPSKKTEPYDPEEVPSNQSSMKTCRDLKPKDFDVTHPSPSPHSHRPSNKHSAESGLRLEAPASDLIGRIGDRRSTTGHGAVACFYVRKETFEVMTQSRAYSAVYLSQRTTKELGRKIAVTLSVDPARVSRILWRSVKGFDIVVDDDVVANIHEGQNMLVAVTDVGPPRLTSVADSDIRDNISAGGDDLGLQLELLFWDTF